jgi:hypothetical protein
VEIEVEQPEVVAAQERHHLLQVLVLLGRVVVVELALVVTVLVALVAAVLVATPQMEPLVRPIQVVAVVGLITILAVQAVPVSSLSKSHLRTMPHSHLV